jgi:uncharacterized protein
MISQARRIVLLVIAVTAGSAAAQNPSWPPVGEPSAAARVAGRWLWADLVTTDVARSSDFYARVFGWSYRTVPGEAGGPGYVTIIAGGQTIGGIVPARIDKTNSGARWIGLISGDPKIMAARAQERGGSVVVAPRPLPGRGEIAVLVDPSGARFAVLRADRGDPPDVLGREGEWLWAELWTPDPERAAAFYREVFGYAVAAGSAGTPDSYVLTAAGRARAGIMRSPDAELNAAWIPYVRVGDVARTVARAEQAGARVIVAPRVHHRSQLAVLVDPLGAPFAVADWRSP